MTTPADEVSDEHLMRRYVERGDEPAYAQLFARYSRRVHATFRRSGMPEAVADELLQQTWLHVHRARNDFRLDGRFRPWLFAIAMNVRREHWRSRARRPEDPLEEGSWREPSVGPQASTSTDRLVRRALADLPDDQREVIVLHWFEELPFPEIAEIVGASVSAVKVRAHRGYEKLRAALKTR